MMALNMSDDLVSQGIPEERIVLAFQPETDGLTVQ